MNKAGNPILEPIVSKKNKKNKKELQAADKHEADIEALKYKAPIVKVDHNKDKSKVRDLVLDNITLTVAAKTLLEDASMQFVYGRKYGLVGRNGIGKTCLMTSIVRREFEGFPGHLQIFLVEQEIEGNDKSVLQTVLEVDAEREELLNEEKELEKDQEANGHRLNEIFIRLEEIGAFEAEGKASIILRGLGFSNEDLERPTKSFSGGWRMRVALARALFANPDILLLDEPTNHLDLEAVMWLEDYLVEWPNTCIIVSHAREFLNVVCTDIYHYQDAKLTYYKGNYDEYDRKRSEVIMQRRKESANQKDKMEHVQKFIDRFRANAKRASMVQSRIKALNKMELIEEILEDPTIVFRFPDPEELAPPLLKIEDGSFGYSPEKPLLKGIEFGVTMESRIAIVGSNGCGKTTLLNLLLGELELNEGHQSRNMKLRISMFTQHFIDQLDLKLSPLEQLMRDFPGNTQEKIRGYLGSFGITGPLALRPHYLLSGGQKSRVAFAISFWKNPQIMILDEPTNHLDIDAINALILALNNYTGGVLIVSHDQHLIQSVCDEIWYIKNKRLIKFKGDFDEYRKYVDSERK